MSQGVSRVRILIAGCGYVGSALGKLLAAEGHKVFGLRRNTGILPPEIEPVAVNLSKPVLPEKLPRELDFVFYAVSSGGSGDEAYRTAYVDGPRYLIEALSTNNQRLRRFFFVSSTRVYDQSNGEWVDEGSPTEPEGYAGRRLLEGERRVLDGPFPATVLRLAGIYGPSRTRSIERALKAPPAGGTPVYTNRIHRDDCAGALRHLMLLPEPESVYVGVDHEPADRGVVAEWLAGRTGIPLAEGLSEASRSRTNKRCSNARLVASGYEFRYPTFREGFSALLEGASG